MTIKLSHEDAPGIEVYFLKVTPEVAKELLALNTKGQRTISNAAVERYASDMVTQDWYVNGDTIKISRDNELIDGQHRLSSIIESGEPQVLLIVHGLDKEAMITIDAGRKRTYADLLKMRGLRNHTIVAAINSRIWYWFHGNYATRGVGRVDNPLHLSSTPSNAQKDMWMAKIEAAYGITIEAAAAFGVKAYGHRPGISSSTYGFAWTILSGIDKDLREGFFHEVLYEAASPKMGYPIQALHNRLARLKTGEAMDNVDQLDALFSVYNAWLKGVTTMETVRPPRPVRWNIVETPKDYKELGA
jgi:sulfur carrier protein ThiS